ncbi:MAG: histidine kinase [Acidobacteriota bacterium]|nr:histidine kinase [Acidobacteriota bacterium]
MDSLNTASLINLLGFTVGIALYALLLVMVVRHRKTKRRFSFDFLLLTTAVLGLLWNVGELSVFVLSDFGGARVSPVLLAISYSALGFLPSVVVHSAWKNSENENTNIRWLTFSAYALSIFASFLHFQSAIFSDVAPSSLALQILTFGSLALLAGLLVFAFRQTLDKKAVWITALLVFTVSALHLSAQTEEDSWLVELIAHQSSLPLAMAILLQDYRFAFADLFLKRALSLILLATVAFGLYVFVAVPLLAWHETHARNDVQAAVLVLSLWMATALIYPQLHRFAVWFVDKIILRRANYETLQIEIARVIEKRNDIKSVLDEVCKKLAAALTATEKSWNEIQQIETETNLPAVNFTARNAEIFIPASEPPFYEICLSDFTGGRNLLSDEIQMLEAVGLLAARRIDNLRAAQERFEQEIQAQEFSKLATEAQLRALRAQINPHFLFNALTTIGYLINAAPEKAFETLMKLTQLLRGILRASGEFSTLGDEIKLIESYLEIEQARFEERLKVKIDAPPALFHLKIPSLILQPLVENAVKHGIEHSKRGGEVEISARLDANCLTLEVADTGAGFDKANLRRGIGLSNVENRLQKYFGAAAQLSLTKQTTGGAIARISFPVEGKIRSTPSKNATGESAKSPS